MATQFRQDQSLDLEATAQHIEALLGTGISGIVMLGSLGENNALQPEEKLQVLRAAVEVVGGKVPVVSGVSEINTAASCQFAAAAQQAGVDGLMVLPAMAYKAEADEALPHFRAVAAASDLPIILYNNPIAYHVDLNPEHFSQLADEPKFVGIKESSGDPRRFTEIANETGNRYALFAGVDDLALECTMLGATGWIAGIGLAFPQENQLLWDLMMAGKWEQARTVYRWYNPLLKLDTGVKFVQKIKLALQEMGMGSEWVRMPRLPLSGIERETVLATIRECLKDRPSAAGLDQ